MRALLWVWIVGTTTLLFFMPPVVEGGMSKGAFERSVLESSFYETRIDISRLIITLLAINFLPAVALWRYDQLCEWLRRHKRKIVVVACVLACVLGVLFLVVVGGTIYEHTRRVARTPSTISLEVVSPSPASAAPVKSPSSGFVDATPTPVRRAIPVSE
jgi:hypothetical protein